MDWRRCAEVAQNLRLDLPVDLMISYTQELTEEPFLVGKVLLQHTDMECHQTQCGSTLTV